MFIEEEKLDLSKFPRLPCPTCDDGLLKIVKETLTHKHPSDIKNLPDHPNDVREYEDEDGKTHRQTTYWDIEGTKYEKFISSFYLECDRELCQEIVTTCGETKLDGYYEVVDNDEPYFFESDYFFPKFFYPTVRLFNYPKDTPENVKKELLKAFSLFWSNPSACANSLRKTTERIIDYKEGKSSNTLHRRIENLKSDNSELKKFLMAVKWIGNDGSHEEIELEHYDVIFGFKFIEKCLIELFEKKTMDLNSIAEKINTTKSSISKSE
jgi:hypothetical protein